MRMSYLKIGWTMLVVAVACAGVAAAAEVPAATVDPDAIDLGYPKATDNLSIGWRFFVDEEITITHLGLYDDGDNGLASTHTMGIWRVNKTGGLTLMCQVDIGPEGTTEDHHVYVDIEDITLVPDPVPEVINGVEYYERWLLGVWTGENDDGLTIRPTTAATIAAEDAGLIRMENFTWKSSTTFTYPWGNNSEFDYFGVNFKYLGNSAPVAGAGDDLEIYTAEQAVTILQGTATDADGDDLQYQWSQGATILQGWTDVVGGAAPLDLSTLPAFSVGDHTLTLEVSDGTLTGSDTMTLSVFNTPPDVEVTPTSQTVELNVDDIVIGAELADFDGDVLGYEWLVGSDVLGSGTVDAPDDGSPTVIPDLIVLAGDLRFPLGTHQVELVVDDGAEGDDRPVVAVATVTVQDTTAPTLAPMPSTTMLWPPNHTMRPVTIQANAADSGGGPVTLTVEVTSNEPDPDDWIVESVDSATGVIELQLRAERSGSGDGRIYTVTITATDGEDNASTASVEICVPHDKRKKK